MKNANSFWLIAAAFFFSCMTITLRYCGQGYFFYDLMFARYLLTSLILLVLLKLKSISFRTEHPMLIGGRCAFGVLSAAINTYLVTQLPAAVAQCFNYTSAFWIVLIFFLTFTIKKIKFPLIVIAPVVVGFSGILVTLNPRMEAISNSMLFVCTIYGFCAAQSSLFLTRLGKFNESAIRVAFYFSVSSTIFGGVLSLVYGSDNQLRVLLDPMVWLSVVFLFLYLLSKTYSWEHGNALLNSVFMFLGLPFVLILGFLCLDEFPKTHQLVGIALILTSAVFSYFAVGKHFKSSKGV